ncbi:MAG TPA: LacI family DNA-binding transcriptional regulator [Anaerolineales bacterium]|nr:LacI family DNA-binding transcriptional regulator [Anaerolineales bacterium]
MVKRVTIKDVAREAGTSYQTVSRIINNKPDVATDTRLRVLEVIEKLNYRPTMAATSRSNPKTHIMAIAISPFNEYLLYEGDPHLLRLIHGVDQALAIRNYSLLFSTIKITNDGKIDSRLLKRQFADGVIMRLSMDDRGQAAGILQEKGYPVVVIGYSNNKQIPSVHSDDENGGYTQAQHLLALGHKKFGIICGPAIDPATILRKQGFDRALVMSGLESRSVQCVTGNYSVEGGYNAVSKLLENDPELTAIVAFSDTMAIGAMQWLRENDYLVPSDISIIGYDDIPTAQRQDPQLTTIRIPSLEEGQQAVEVLFNLLDNHKLPKNEYILPVRLITRNSTAVQREK